MTAHELDQYPQQEDLIERLEVDLWRRYELLAHAYLIDDTELADQAYLEIQSRRDAIARLATRQDISRSEAELFSALVHLGRKTDRDEATKREDDSSAEVAAHRTRGRGAGTAEEAFTELYIDHYTAVRSYASVCVAASEVDDVVADTFLVAWRRFTDVPEEWARGWLIGVARNVVRSRHRRSRREINFIEQIVNLRPEVSMSLVDDGVSTEDLEVLKTGFQSLKESDQELLLLAGPYGLPVEEIAVALGIQSSAVGVRLHRAQTRLRSTIESIEGGGEATTLGSA